MGVKLGSVTLGEEHRLRVLENRVLRKIFEPKRDEDASWRKLHNDELHSLYSSPKLVRVIISRMMKAGMGGGGGVHMVLVRRPKREKITGKT
jgi:hypothetical protein